MADNIVNPELVWVEKRCYRNVEPSGQGNFQDMSYQDNFSPIEEHNDNLEEDDLGDDHEVVPIGDNRFSSNIHVSQSYIGSIIGTKGSMRQRIENDTMTSLKIPRMGQKGDIVITGCSIKSVKAARRRINTIVESTRSNRRPTHFISIPTNNDVIKENYEKFKIQCISEGKGIDETLFTSPEKLHLTVAAMCIMDDDEQKAAVDILNKAKEEILVPYLKDKPQLKIFMNGVSYMNDDPSKVNVLYAKVHDESGLLQPIFNSIAKLFWEAGFGKPFDNNEENVKMHVTLMNSRHRAQKLEQQGKRFNRKPFDAAYILDAFKDYDFGSVELNNVYLSVMHSQGEDGYYQNTASISCY